MTSPAAIPVKAPAPAHPLSSYTGVVVIDHGAPGTGHQIAVMRLLEKLHEAGYAGAVHLYYERAKTRLYADRLNRGAAFTGAPEASWKLYHEPWDGSYRTLTVTCHPLGQPVVQVPSLLAHRGYDVRRYWTEIAWPGAAGLPVPAPVAPKPAGAVPPPPPKPAGPRPPSQLSDEERGRFQTGTPALATLQRTFVAELLVTGVAQGRQLGPADLAGCATLAGPVVTMFAAFDEAEVAPGGDYYADGPSSWLAAIQRLTGQANPVTVILQPFLWGRTVQVRRGPAIVADLQNSIKAAGGVPVYSSAPKPEPHDLLPFVRTAYGSSATVNPDAIAAILQRAKARQIDLVSVYYTGSSGEIDYRGVVRAIYWAYGYATDISDRPLVVALLGDEVAEGTDRPGDRIAVTLLDIGAGSAPDPLSGAVEPVSRRVHVVRVGRTPVMDLFQRYASLVVTEGANTWQEVLTLGRPALTVRTSETRPWAIGLPGGEAGADMVESASKALVHQAGSTDQPGPTDVAFLPLVDFVTQAGDPRSPLNAYFRMWATALSKRESDQFAEALTALSAMSSSAAAGKHP